MCGIFAYIGTSIVSDALFKSYYKTIKRGPDDNILKIIKDNLVFGFHRLSINDTSFKGNQPLFHPNKPLSVICNGEIYNYKELKEKYSIQTYSNSDCEILLYLYENFGIEKTIQLIDSESFAFCIYDGITDKVYIARDRFGVRPLFMCKTNKNEYIFASESKSIVDLVDTNEEIIEQFSPSSYMCINLSNYEATDNIPYYLYEYPTIKYDMETIYENIRNKLTAAVKKRLLSDRPIGCLLSGGLDSSLICALVCKELKKQNKPTLNTFSIGIKGSPDLHYAKLVAKHIGSNHHTIELTEEDFLDAIPEVIYHTETYDTTTIRASTGNYLVGKYIKENTDIVVVFNGDGSDEQSGYRYLKNAPSVSDFKDECVKLLKEIHYFDVLRSDRSLSSNWSLETRTPFLDTDFVDFYMSIETELKMYNENHIEKYLLRKSFDNMDLLPKEVLWRAKEAFSDGCSNNERSWHKIIQEYVDTKVTDETFFLNNKYTINKPILKESFYYRVIFEKHYPNMAHIIPHFWLPKWCGNIDDPSARELDCYYSINNDFLVNNSAVKSDSIDNNVTNNSENFAHI